MEKPDLSDQIRFFCPSIKTKISFKFLCKKIDFLRRGVNKKNTRTKMAVGG